MRRASRVSIGALLTVLAVELVDELVDGVGRAALPSIRSELSLNYTQIGLVLGVPAVVGNLIEPFIAIGSDLGRRRALILGGGMVFIVSLVFVAGAPGFFTLLAGFMLFSPASGAFVSLSQASLMDADPPRREHNMARWTVSGSIGNTLGPFGVAAAVALAGSWRAAYAAVAALTLVALARMTRFPIAESTAAHSSLVRGFADAFQQLRRREVVRHLVLLELSDLMLDLLTGFLAVYLVDIGRLTVAQAALVIGGRAAGALVGELLVVFMLERVSGLLYLRRSVLVTFGLYPAFLIVSPPWAKVLIAVALSISTAGWYSILQARLYHAIPERSGIALALKNVMGLAWGVLPVGLGLVAEEVGLTPMMWLLWAGPLGLLIGLDRRQDEAPVTNHG